MEDNNYIKDEQQEPSSEKDLKEEQSQDITSENDENSEHVEPTESGANDNVERPISSEPDSNSVEVISEEPDSEEANVDGKQIETSIEAEDTTPETVEPPKSSDEEEKESEEEKVSSQDVEKEEPAVPEPKDQKDENQGQSSSDNQSEHHDEHEEHHHEEEVDYTHFSKEELVKAIEEQKDAPVMVANKHAKSMRPVFNEIKNKEREAALKKFIDEGGESRDFDYHLDELTQRFEAAFRFIKEKKQQFNQEKEKEKDDNLSHKNAVLDKLRELVDSEETNTSIDALKIIQEEWRSIGPVPPAQAKTLWANYNALLDRFYDNRSIYFELKELDRKKNLKLKLELCERAEKLEEVQLLHDAIKELNELHDEFKHIGPVPKEDQEALWQRFKAASDKVYDRRKAFVEELKTQLHANFETKKELGDKAQEFADFQTDRIKEWNEKTREILELQKSWEAIGGVPRDKAKEVNKHFWNAFKSFFHHKNQFFKKLEGERHENLKKKEELVEQAAALKDSDDWDATTDALKKLQQEWKNIGPVPEKVRNEIYARFKEACDTFFNRKRGKAKEDEKEYYVNLEQKEGVCAEIEELAEQKSNDLDIVRALQERFNQIGFVPRDSIRKIQNRLTDALDKFLANAEGLDPESKEAFSTELKFAKLKSGPNAKRKIYQKENTIRSQISKIENDISLWRNNLEFFANSKTADKLREEFDTKIEHAQQELKSLRQELKVIRNL